MEFNRGVLYVAVFLVQSTALAYALTTNTMSPKDPPAKYDLVVIGGGAAGLTAAKFATTFGKSAVIIEKSRLGGDCTWTGCVPSKTLIASSKATQTIAKAEQFGLSVQGEVSVDMKAIKERVDGTIQHIYDVHDSPEALKKLGVDVISGGATLKGSNVVSVSKSDGENPLMDIHAKDGILICTGACPKSPDISGIDQVEYITYEEAFSLEEVPKTMTVIGGGPIGCELAQAYARLGATVTVVADSLLPREEPEAGELMQRVFESDGIVVTNSRLDFLEGQGGKAHTAICKDGNKVQGDLLLVAVGRQPNVSGLGLETLGVELNDAAGIKTNAKLQTNVKGLYAAGDCTGDRQFTHYAGYQGAVGARNILLPLTDPGVLTEVPGTTFTDPQVASIGLTEKQAKEEYGDKKVAVAFQRVEETDRGLCDGVKEGFIKVIYKKKGYEILGATISSPVAGELIAEIAVAMKAKLSFDMLATVMHTYPSHSFALQSMAAEVYYDKLVKSKPLLNFLKKIGL